jgi:hypothetical protein
MASTYTVGDAVRYCKLFIKNIPVVDVQLIAADIVNGMIWKAYPWRWSTVTLTPIALVDGTQDYSSAPSNYYRLLRARIARTDSTPDEYDDPLIIVNKLEPYLHKMAHQSIRNISYEGHLDKFRLESAVSVGSGVTLQLQGEYQKQPTKIASTGDTLPFPDQYFDAFNAGLLWKFYQFADDPRGGGMQKAKSGGASYAGAYGAFMDAIADMAASEGYPISPTPR